MVPIWDILYGEYYFISKNSRHDCAGIKTIASKEDDGAEELIKRLKIDIDRYSNIKNCKIRRRAGASERESNSGGLIK